MTRLEELTLNLADGVLSDAEENELHALLAENEQARERHVRILQIEAGLRAQRQLAELPKLVMAQLRLERADTVARGVMEQIKAQPDTTSAGKPRGNIVPLPFKTRLRRAWLPLAACFVLLAGIGFWLFGSPMGDPVLSEVTGANVFIERQGGRVAAVAGVRLQNEDILRTPEGSRAVIAFAPEQTRITLLPGTEFKLAAWARGKRFDLSLGAIEASAARQRPFQPMLVKTPQAVARVIGTRFTLTVTTNSTRLDVAEGLIRFTRTRDGQSVRVRSQHSAVAAPNFEMSALPFTGSILREYWTNVPVSYSTINLRVNPKFPDHPDGRDYLKKFETPNHLGTNYGARICGYLQPPVTGEYSFWIIAGHYGELYLSSNDKPENRTWIAHSQDGKPGDWDAAQHQHTASIQLTAGRSYLIEAFQVEGSDGNDYLAVAWQGPGRPREIIPGEFLAPLDPPKGKDQ